MLKNNTPIVRVFYATQNKVMFKTITLVTAITNVFVGFFEVMICQKVCQVAFSLSKDKFMMNLLYQIFIKI